MKISDLEKEFYEFCKYKEELLPATIQKYQDCLRCFKKNVGDLELEEVNTNHVYQLRKILIERGCGSARIASVIFCLRRFFRYCREEWHFKVISYKKLEPPKRIKKRQPEFLTPEETRQFLEAINLEDIHGLRNRAIVETILGSGMRIGETLSLNRDSINFIHKEARVIGKGNKERTVVFTERALEWIKKYLDKRSDKNEALFVTHCQDKRLNVACVQQIFHRIKERSGLKKNVTAHILRHTFCSILTQAGVDIYHISRLAGHEDISTTIRFYANLNIAPLHEDVKKLDYGEDIEKGKMIDFTPRWSKKYDRCRMCKTTKVQHQARGYCNNCYMQVLRKELKERPKEKIEELRVFDGFRWSVHYANCCSCGTTERKHHAQGLCKLCYTRKQRHEKPDKQAKFIHLT